MRLSPRLRGVMALAVLATSLSVVAVDFAEARRGGSFGSRGSRTFSPPAATQTAPTAPGGLQRSMTPQNQAGPTANRAATPAAQQQNRGGMFGGLAGGLLGGLVLGGLVGMLMGNGLGGLGGILGLLIQVVLVVVVVRLIMGFFRRRNAAAAGPTPAYAGASPATGSGDRFESTAFGSGGGGSANASRAATPPPPMHAAGGGDEIALDGSDFDTFEQLLAEVQAAFTREDFARLRTLCTPEIVSYLSEELSENAVRGVRNDVTDVRLLQGDLSEAWREDDNEFATVAMRYESVDVMRDRTTGKLTEGSPVPSETIELWTFVRPRGGTWKLSAIQET